MWDHAIDKTNTYLCREESHIIFALWMDYFQFLPNIFMDGGWNLKIVTTNNLNFYKWLL